MPSIFALFTWEYPAKGVKDVFWQPGREGRDYYEKKTYYGSGYGSGYGSFRSGGMRRFRRRYGSDNDGSRRRSDIGMRRDHGGGKQDDSRCQCHGADP